jgi:4-hydroxy-tetrahydrodipicolinate reductase
LRVAVVGHGRMGREVEAMLRERGHQPAVVVRGQGFPPACSVGIDFSTADAVLANARSALQAGARYVVGTTGWSDRAAELRGLVEAGGGGLVYAANFSLGMNLFYRIAREASALLAGFPEYDAWLTERHHEGKADAPSGTAKALAAIVAAARANGRQPPISSVRAGGIVGDHLLGFDSGGDEILLEHRARSRRGFALGAVLAAEWIATRNGFHPFEDALDDLLRQRSRDAR